MKILLTAFDPFANEKINPTLEVLKKLEDNILNAQIIKLKLPTIFDKSSKILEEKIKQNKSSRVNKIVSKVGCNHNGI